MKKIEFLYDKILSLNLNMKRQRSSEDLNLVDINDEVLDIINIAKEELEEAKIECQNGKFKNLPLLKHIKYSVNKLNIIKKEAIKRNISNESMNYIEEIQDDFINKIYYDSDVDNTDEELLSIEIEDGGITF